MGISKLKVTMINHFPSCPLKYSILQENGDGHFYTACLSLNASLVKQGKQCLLKCDIVKVILPLITALLHWGNGQVRHSWCYRGDEMLCWCFLLQGRKKNKTKHHGRKLFVFPAEDGGWEERRGNCVNVHRVCSNRCQIRLNEQCGWLVFFCVCVGGSCAARPYTANRE